MKKITEPKNHLSTNHYVVPGNIQQTMTRKELKETLLATDGWVMACGYLWDVKSKHLGAGVYSIRLEKRSV